MRTRLQRRAPATVACLALVFGGLVIDLSTPQQVVVAIIYNIPIVLSAAFLSRRLTSLTLAASLGATVAAGYINAIASNDIDTATVLNRCLVASSLILVGAMTLLFERRSADVKTLEDAVEATKLAHALRHLLVALSGPLGFDELMSRAVGEVSELLKADNVAIVAVDGDRFALPRWSSTPYSALAEPGTMATWALDVLPANDAAVVTTRTDRGATTLGKLSRRDGPDLIVIAERPRQSQSSDLLREALGALSAVSERATELQRLRHLAGEG
ncbi:MAG: hypothetical protein RIB98_12000 [Acidimicrobiales bacterium]